MPSDTDSHSNLASHTYFVKPDIPNEINTGDIMKAACILVIENNEALRDEVTKHLEKEGYTVVAVDNVLDGLRHIYEAYPDLIIMGNGMPLVKGETPLSIVRRVSYLPILVIGSAEKTVEWLQVGADDYITRPASMKEMVARVHSMVRRKRPTAVMNELEEEQ
jgi:DNA-binding response OmpR family regulator